MFVDIHLTALDRLMQSVQVSVTFYEKEQKTTIFWSSSPRQQTLR
jgi:hypothetical protein